MNVEIETIQIEQKSGIVQMIGFLIATQRLDNFKLYAILFELKGKIVV